MPKVSVIIPVYNVEKYLRECLDSVINQTLDDIEILCIDDGSTDNSLSILNDYAKRDSRIVVVEQENIGVGNTRNKGIKTAKGEFVCFMDPDDYYPHEDILETLYVNAKEHDVYICGGEFADFCDDMKTLNQKFSSSLAGYLFEKNGIIEYKDYQFDYGFHRFIYNREFLIENNLYFPPFKRFQDPPFFISAMYKAERFFAVDKIVYGYRYGHSQVSWSNEKVNDFLEALYYDLTFAAEHNLDKLFYYSFTRFCEHYPFISKSIDRWAGITIKKISVVEPKINSFMFKYKMKIFIKNVFSIFNSKDGTHKILSILGFKIKFKKKNRSQG